MKMLRDRGLEETSSPSRHRGSGKTRRGAGPVEATTSGLKEVVRDVNQMVLAHSGSLTFIGLTLAAFVTRKFLAIPVAVAVCIAQELAKDRLRQALHPKPRRR